MGPVGTQQREITGLLGSGVMVVGIQWCDSGGCWCRWL